MPVSVTAPVTAPATLPLGVFDSGVGGLTVLSALQRALPHEDFIYLGDTARLPYGGKPLDMVRGFAEEISDALVARGVKGIVVACNTASAAALPGLAARLAVPVWGVVEPGVKAAVKAAGGGRVAVLATQATIRSRAYQSRLEAAGLATWAKACPLFVPIVEEGVSDTAIARLVAKHYLDARPLLSAVILGCTHYPILKPILREVLGPEVVLVDSAEETAAVVAGELLRLGLATAALQNSGNGPGKVQHLVSGDLSSYVHTARGMGGPAGSVERISFGEGGSHEAKPSPSRGQADYHHTRL